MKPPPFRYYRARSLPEAIELLDGAGGGAKLLAGGQSLIPLLNLRLARPEALIDLNSIPDLSYIRREGAEIVIGAMTRQRAMEFSSLLAKELPMLVEAIGQIGHPAIRNRGTLGGSLAHADPAAELPCVLTALNARLVVAGAKEEREIRAEEFSVGYYATALSEQEILKEARIPVDNPPAGWSFLEFSRRHGDFALSEASVVLFAEGKSDRCASARVVIGGSVERPLRVTEVEKLLQGEALLTLRRDALADLLAEAARQTEAEIEASGAANEESDYPRHLAGVLVRRGLESAIERWRGK